MQRLSKEFYDRHPLELAELLLGRTLYSRRPDGTAAGRIVEVEAYCGKHDPASHAYRRRTDRNAVMFGPPGRLYVYFTYGMHHCANIVADEEGSAGAVLLRAVEPLEGLELMARRRRTDKPGLLAKGPGRLSQAFGLTLADNGADLSNGDVWVGQERRTEAAVERSVRIGIKPEMQQLWRFYEPGPWVSGRRRPIG
ncbi:MAG: DNA-3-methyladenine glycosylase [Actinobacteria bacterium]|nr:DNA-3-methyladenine glycosylase [Actinomycetota bacterium]